MNIQNISKKEKEVVVSLTIDELIKLCNVLYGAKEEEKNDTYRKLLSQLMVARDVCQYGHIDDFCLTQIVKCREGIKNK